MVKKISLGKSGKFAIVDDEDYDHLMQWNWSLDSSGYAYRRVYMHQEVKPNMGKLDHRSRVRLDNTRHNLRPCTTSQNMMNTAPVRGSSKYKGVHWHKRDMIWSARIAVRKKEFHLGNFKEEILAAKAYDAAAIKYHGEFAYLNFPLCIDG